MSRRKIFPAFISVSKNSGAVNEISAPDIFSCNWFMKSQKADGPK